MKAVEVKIKKLSPLFKLPEQATEFAGGWDVIATEIEQVSDDLVICKLGFALEIPFGYKLTLVPRSSLTKTKWVIQNAPGLGDSDFRHEYQLRFRALPESIYRAGNGPILEYPEFPYEVGDRIGQIYLEEVIDIKFVESEELEESKRLGGYGSTGR